MCVCVRCSRKVGSLSGCCITQSERCVCVCEGCSRKVGSLSGCYIKHVSVVCSVADWPEQALAPLFIDRLR